jgi:hypothetical protein
MVYRFSHFPVAISARVFPYLQGTDLVIASLTPPPR